MRGVVAAAGELSPVTCRPNLVPVSAPSEKRPIIPSSPRIAYGTQNRPEHAACTRNAVLKETMVNVNEDLGRRSGKDVGRHGGRGHRPRLSASGVEATSSG